MCDGLAANKVAADCKVIPLNCLDHARRAFFDLRGIYKRDCDYVLGELRLVYKADKEAKEVSMDARARLLHHQEHSRPAMKRLGEWMVKQLESGAVEENSELGKAIIYCLKRWTALNEFHHIEGVPDNWGHPLRLFDSVRPISYMISSRSLIFPDASNKLGGCPQFR